MPKLHLTVKVGDALDIEGIGKITVEHKTGQRTRLAIDLDEGHKIKLVEKERPTARDWQT